MKTVHVLNRRVTFKSGVQVEFPVGVFSDKSDALKEGNRAAATLSRMHEGVHAALGAIGITGITHVAHEIGMVEGAGLVIVGPNG